MTPIGNVDQPTGVVTNCHEINPFTVNLVIDFFKLRNKLCK